MEAISSGLMTDTNAQKIYYRISPENEGLVFDVADDAYSNHAWRTAIETSKTWGELRRAVGEHEYGALTTPEVASISGHRDARMLFRYAHAERQSVIRKLDPTAPDLRESNNRPSPVARIIHRAASNVLAKGEAQKTRSKVTIQPVISKS